MRTVLLGGAAVLALSTGYAGLASAQTLPPVPTEGIIAKEQPIQGANDSNNYQAASLPGGVANPTPGSVVVRFNGRVVAYGFDENSSLDRSYALSPSAPNTGSGTPAKTQKYGIFEFTRLYAGVDGLATNGLKYGAAVEVRVNSGPTNGSSSNSGSSANTRSSTLYVRREFLYLGGANVGLVRIGEADGVTGIFDNGVTTFQNFDDGAWNGDLPAALPGNAQVTFPFFSQQGAEYGSAKIVYLSPQFAGFDFGAHFAPSSSQSQDDGGPITTLSLTSGQTISGLNSQACAVAASGCFNLASSSAPNDGARFKNQYAFGVRYQNKFGPLAAYGYAAYIGSGHVNYTGTSAFQQYNGLSVGDFGAALTYAGFTVGGHYTYGDFNGAVALQPKGGAKGETWLGGAQYAVGPLTVGASYYDFTSQGSPALVNLSQRHETGLAVGSTYGLAPGMSVFLSYIYGTRHQGGFNFESGASATGSTIRTATASRYNSIRADAAGLGLIVKW